jgi:hypothetical protein
MGSDYAAIAARAKVSFGFRQLTGSGATEGALRSVLARHPLEDWLQTIGKINKEHARLPPDDAAFDRSLASELGPNARAALSKIDIEGARCVSPSSLNTLAREALFASPEVPTRSWPTGLGDFARALLSVIDLFDVPRPHAVDAEETVMSLLLTRAARPSPPLRSTLVRTYRLFVDLPSRCPELLSCSLDERSQELFGMDVARYLALCMTFFVRFDQASRPDEWILSTNYYPSTSISADEFNRAVRSVSATPEEFRTTFQKEFDAGYSGLDDDRPFILRPICEVRPGAFIPIDFGALGDRLIGDGVYWRLRPTDQQGKTEYGATIGRLLERHLWEVARSIYPVASKPEDEHLFLESKFHGFDGPDITVFDDNALMICEIGVDQVNVRDTIHRGSLPAFDRDVTEVVLPRIAQLRRKIDAIRSGAFRYLRHVDPSARIVPMICLLDGFPIAPLLRARLDSAISDSGLLNLDNITRVAIVSADEFELACATVEQGRATMTQLLEGHASDPTTREWPFRDYVRKITGEQPWTRFSDSQFQNAVANVVTEVAGGATANSP